jgi:hypothetical protein
MNADANLDRRLRLIEGGWYYWTMFPGYGTDGPYRSPILIERVVALRTGKGLFRLSFYNSNYASGVRDFAVLCRTLKRAEGYLTVELLHDDGTEAGRMAVITKHFDPPPARGA